MRRRQVLRALACAGGSLAAGCAGSESNGVANTRADTATPSARATTAPATRTTRVSTTESTGTESTGTESTESADGNAADVISPADVRTGSISPVKLPFEEWPRGDVGWCGSSVAEVETIANLSTQYEDDADSYDPLNTAKKINDVVRCYSVERNEGYREKADAMIDALLETSVRRAGAIYVSYDFYYEWHGKYPLMPPNYSGMAQGVLLSPLSRLFRVTGKERYKQLATLFFRSFDRPRGWLATEYADEPWTVTIDSEDYYWIEGVPLTPPGHVFNEMNAAIEGLYEYWRVFETPQSELLLKAALKTVKDHTDDYRRPGKLSYYCLGHEQVAPPRYHELHIEQFGNFYRMTGDEAFKRAAAQYRRDQQAAGATTTEE